MSRGADGAGAHHRHHITGPQQALQRCGNVTDLRDEHRFDLAATAHGTADGATVSAFDRLLACGIDFGDQQRIGRR